MKKYFVSVNEISYYMATEIEAENEEEAEEIYMSMIDEGNVEVNKSEFDEIKVSEVK